MAEKYFCVCVSQLLYSSIRGHSGCFHVSVTADKAAVNMGCREFLRHSISLDMSPDVELLEHMVVVFLILGGTSITFPQRLHQLAAPKAVPEGSPFSASSPAFNLVFLAIAILAGVRWYLVILICMISDIDRALFHVPLGRSYNF